MLSLLNSIRVLLISLSIYACFYSNGPQWFTFQIMFVVGVFNSCLYLLLRQFFSQYPAIYCKRILSGLSACFIVPGCLAVAFDPVFLAEPFFTIPTPLAISIGIELGSSLFDLFSLTTEQLRIPLLIVHHLGTYLTFYYVTFSGFPGLAIAVALLQEGCNPFWYLHWILISSNNHKKHGGLFKLNAFFAIFAYLFIRFGITHPVSLWVTHWCFTVGRVGDLAPTWFDIGLIVVDQIVFFPMNVQNVLKLVKSLSYDEKQPQCAQISPTSREELSKWRVVEEKEESSNKQNQDQVKKNL